MASELPGFHDGFLDGLLSLGSEARMLLRKECGEKFTLVLRDVEALQGDNFRQGNIIFDVVFLGPDELELSDVSELYEFSQEWMKTFSLAEWSEKANAKGLKAI